MVHSESMELSDQLSGSHSLTAPVHPPERDTGPPELHHLKGRYPIGACTFHVRLAPVRPPSPWRRPARRLRPGGALGGAAGQSLVQTRTRRTGGPAGGDPQPDPRNLPPGAGEPRANPIPVFAAPQHLGRWPSRRAFSCRPSGMGRVRWIWCSAPPPSGAWSWSWRLRLSVPRPGGRAEQPAPWRWAMPMWGAREPGSQDDRLIAWADDLLVPGTGA
jgi:hypothetical protein